MSENDDIKDVNECLKGNGKAFERLIDRYQKALFNTAIRMVNDYDDAKDITQTAFIKAFEKLDSFKPEYKFFSWLYRILVNESLNFIGKQRQHMPLEQDIISTADTPEEKFNRDQVSRTIDEAIGALPVDYRMAIVFRHFADLSYQELSYVLNLPVKTVKSRLYTARQKLSRVFTEKGLVANE